MAETKDLLVLVQVVGIDLHSSHDGHLFEVLGDLFLVSGRLSWEQCTIELVDVRTRLDEEHSTNFRVTVLPAAAF